MTTTSEQYMDIPSTKQTPVALMELFIIESEDFFSNILE